MFNNNGVSGCVEWLRTQERYWECFGPRWPGQGHHREEQGRMWLTAALVSCGNRCVWAAQLSKAPASPVGPGTCPVLLERCLATGTDVVMYGQHVMSGGHQLCVRLLWCFQSVLTITPPDNASMPTLQDPRCLLVGACAALYPSPHTHTHSSTRQACTLLVTPGAGQVDWLPMRTVQA